MKENKISPIEAAKGLEKSIAEATSTEKYPEHKKLEKIQKESQAIGEFMEWLINDKKIILSEYKTKDAHWPSPIYTTVNDFLGAYFDIDQKKLEKEKQQMLQEFRELQSANK